MNSTNPLWGSLFGFSNAHLSNTPSRHLSSGCQVLLASHSMAPPSCATVLNHRPESPSSVTVWPVQAPFDPLRAAAAGAEWSEPGAMGWLADGQVLYKRAHSVSL